jgi:hypothetical protein
MSHLPDNQSRPETAELMRMLDAGSKTDPESAWARVELHHPKMRIRPSYVAAAAIIAALISVFSFAPVRAFASNFLALFRVQQINVVRIDPANLQAARERLFHDGDSPRLDQFFSDSLHIVHHGEPAKFTNFTDASRTAGFGLHYPASFDGLPAQYVVQPATDITFKIDLDQIHEILSDAGRPDIQFPEDIDGETVQLSVPRSVVGFYGKCPEVNFDKESDQNHRRRDYDDCKMLTQMPVPTLAAPAGFDMRRIGEAFLQLAGLNAQDAARISAQVDWASTFVLPIPVDPGINYSEVDLDGAKGNLILFQKNPEDKSSYNLVWIRDGVLYCLMGKGSRDEAIEIASALHS